MMKRLLIPNLLFLLLISCSSEDLKGRIVEGETSISVDAEYFQGERTYTLDFDEDREVKLDLETLSGKIYIKVQDSGGKVVLEGSYGSDWNQYGRTSFFIEKGKVTFTLKGEAYSGKARLDWN